MIPSEHYRPDIDGLRAVSILLVVGYHAHPWMLPGGFIGVDIFFVISGFLITRILLAPGGMPLATFYARRIKRIFPGLIVVLLAAYAIGWAILLPQPFRLLGENIVASALFASNLFQLGQVGYFAPLAAENPLLHLWSLGVEEQFYIFWPLALIVLKRSSYRRQNILGAMLVSLGASMILAWENPDWGFYAPIPRAWELLIGGLLTEANLVRKSDSNILGAIGLGAIVASALLFDRSMPFPGALALVPVLGAALDIVSPNAATNRMLLSSQPAVLLGLVSYPLYLWHWPLLAYLGILRHGVPNFLEIWAAVLAAFALSILTYRFIELPVRHRRGVVPALSITLASIAAVGPVTVASGGFLWRFPPELQAIAAVSTDDNPAFRDHCFLEAPGSSFDASCIEPGAKPLLVLWGDSNAAALYPAMSDAARQASFRVARFAAPGCTPILDAGRSATCRDANGKAFALIAASHPEVVVLHAMWGFDNDLAKLGSTIAALRSAGVPRVVVLGPPPVWKRTLPHEIINHYRFAHELPDWLGTGVSGPAEDELMANFGKSASVDFVSLRKVLCDQRQCRVRTAAGEVIATDTIHLSSDGARLVVDAIGRDLFHGTDSRHPQ
ncbi:acyltransferase family protein [uncultured Bradyrhizobium sp.]|jgi:peptidoglycan/LPS O-acetylase OafA/YrhL|uniref:acyltransferase family protein n=1 Tax=uncultured Bradyrhizobium sp. TaxID=199684 RepID=UPI00260928A8|nr:acyltransferase family protein [uncultured Bradyrhizobium sp.]